MNRRFRLGAPLVALLVACATVPPAPLASRAPVWPSARIEVFTDPHILAPSLVRSEDEWKAIEASAFQVFRQGPAILQARVDAWLADRPSMVIVTGDLTREGERASHEEFVRLMKPLTLAGIPVLVIPGNHDVLNPGGPPSVTPAEFAELYHDFGYGSALSRDPASLSYLAEPIPGLRVLALDTARYEDNAAKGREVTAGRIRDASWPWINRVLDEAARDGIPVITLMHHGLIEKFPHQGGLFADYLVADRQKVLERLAARGVSLVLTGHFHTLSTAWADAAGRTVLEVEGGTLSQYPLGWRSFTLGPDRFVMKTHYAEGPFVPQARAMAARGTNELLEGRLRRAGVNAHDSALLTQAFGQAFVAVTAGNPVKPEGWVWPPVGLGVGGALAVSALGSVPNDLWKPNPPDDLSLDLPWPLPPPEAAR